MLTWAFTITPVNVPDKIVSVSATASDDTPDVADITVTLRNADISSPAKKAEALDSLWAKYAKKATDRVVSDGLATEIAALETSAKANFEGRSL